MIAPAHEIVPITYQVPEAFFELEQLRGAPGAWRRAEHQRDRDRVDSCAEADLEAEAALAANVPCRGDPPEAS